ncbi:ABC transporter permease [Fructilactobacillus ixorae]|uniref:Transport permease protein n=1 Tax=Fructilactobacillus ixorae TaxID=1750535 RepID=A0ABY5C3V0_9LACO|nr:ABC transporter permease [Fructilactobacillus ixorae]USS93252.1 ABC transporter permease [Fructilactobacillus ixorae]
MNLMQKQPTKFVSNVITMTYRNLLKTFHNPDSLLDVVVQPVLFMVLFGYLFGGAIAGNVNNYLPIIVPGILMQALLSAASGSGTQISYDMHTGIYTRFKSLPISPLAPLAGQLLADIFRLVLAAVAAIVTGYLMGWRSQSGFGWLIVVIILDVFLGWALSWIFALYGLIAKSATMVESISLMTMLLLIFLSNAFVPVQTLPRFMRFLVKINPVSYVISASRTILNHGFWPSDAWIVLGAGVLTVLVCSPLTVIVYNYKNNK